MKSQHEFFFASEVFNMAGEAAKAETAAPTIMAEMTEAEREQVRLTSKEREIREVCPGYREGAPIASEFKPMRESVEAVAGGGLTFDGEQSHEEHTPGLAPGSYWTVQAMRKAIATL